MEARRMKEGGGGCWFEGRKVGRERDGSDGRRVVMGGLIFHDCNGCTEAPGV